MAEIHKIVDYQNLKDMAEKEIERTIEKTGGGGNNSGMIEQRVARLEADVSEIKSDIKEMRVMLARGATTAGVWGAAGAAVAAIIATALTLHSIGQSQQSNMLSAFQAGLSVIQAGAEPKPK